ncbi:MAG: ThuA domain-containing protein [Chitinophagaceae bacterium]|nr:ThuA domain-containing protein [Chitinophagaceae bacterium]
MTSMHSSLLPRVRDTRIDGQKRRYSRLRSTVPWVILIVVVLCGLSKAKPASSIRVLIVTGTDIEAHNWRETTIAAMEELSKDPRIKADTLTDIYKLGLTDLSRYDVLYLNFNNWGKPDPDAQAENNLKQYVARGGGLVVVHFASGSFETWPEYVKLAGKVWDRKNTHDPRGAFKVEIADSLHPITKGMTSYDTDDELYICLTGNEPVHLLARAKSVVTGKYHPMAFTLAYKKGRIFHTALGHDARAIHVAGTAELIRRGVAWAAGRPVTPAG